MPCYDKEDTKAIQDQYRLEGLVCVRNALPANAADMVEEAVRTMPLKPDPRTPERHTKCLRADHPLHKAMYDDAGLQRLYKTLHGYKLAPTAFPWKFDGTPPIRPAWDGTATFRCTTTRRPRWSTPPTTTMRRRGSSGWTERVKSTASSLKRTTWCW